MAEMIADKEKVSSLIQKQIGEPFPFLSILHSLQDFFGYLPEESLRQVSTALEIPLSELYGTVTFYHFFKTVPPSEHPKVEVCGGPVCCREPLEVLEEKLKEARLSVSHSGEVERISCPGRCDMPVPLFVGNDVFVDARADCVDDLSRAKSPLPPETGLAECLFRDIRKVGKETPQIYKALEQARRDPEAALGNLKVSGLLGRGGAGFPTWRKWEAVRAEKAPVKYIVCNADEGEPGCFKDRLLLDHDPHAVFEGMAIAGELVGATVGIIYLRYEYPETMEVLETSLREVREKNLSPGFSLYVRRGAGAYICGEETSLLNSLEGKSPIPRDKPPYPTTHGLDQLPTVINNVETLAAIPPILLEGGKWYEDLGLGEHAGTKIYSVSGDISRPGNYEMPMGLPLPELIRHAGGIPNGKKVKAVTMAGISGGFLGGEDLEVTLDIPSVAKTGSMLGAGGIIVYDETRCMVRAALACMKFFAYESCGKCFPCRIGTTRSSEILAALKGRSEAVKEMGDLGRVMGAASACGLGLAAPLVTDSLMKYWPDEVKAHMEGRCLAGECPDE